MKPLLFVGLLNVMLLPTWLAAQRGGGGGGGRGMGVAGRLASPPARPVNRALRLNGSWRNLSTGRGDSYAYGGFGWPGDLDYGDYGYPSGYGQPYDQFWPANRILQPVQNWAPAPLPRVRPETHDYQWQDSGYNPAAVLSVVAKDGTVHSATAVWVQDGMVCFFTPEGAGGQLPLVGIDRERTQQVNAEHDLKLQLPGVASSSQAAVN